MKSIGDDGMRLGHCLVLRAPNFDAMPDCGYTKDGLLIVYSPFIATPNKRFPPCLFCIIY